MVTVSDSDILEEIEITYKLSQGKRGESARTTVVRVSDSDIL